VRERKKPREEAAFSILPPLKERERFLPTWKEVFLAHPEDTKGKKCQKKDYEEGTGRGTDGRF